MCIKKIGNPGQRGKTKLLMSTSGLVWWIQIQGDIWEPRVKAELGSELGEKTEVRKVKLMQEAKFLFNWSIVDLQCCVNFCCTANWFSYTYIYILVHILFHYGLSQDIEYSSLCCTVGPCCLSILCIIVCIC